MLLAMTLLLREDLSTTFGRGDGSGSHRQDEARQTRRAAMSLQKRGREWYQLQQQWDKERSQIQPPESSLIYLHT